MKWNSVAEIVESLNLKSSVSDIEAIKRELKAKMANIHPDRNGGKFSTKDDEITYKRYGSAHEYIAQIVAESRALISVSHLPDIIRAIHDTQLGATSAQINTLRTECLTESHSFAKKRYALPKVGSGVFAGICGFLFTFSGQLISHPVLGPYAKKPQVQMFLLGGALYSGMFWLLAWYREKKEEAHADWLVSEDGRQHIFRKLLDEVGGPISAQHPRFTIRKIVDLIRGGDREFRAPSLLALVTFFPRPTIAYTLAEKIAEMHLLELERRGAIHKIKDPSFESVYEFNKNVIQNKDEK